MAAAVWYLNWVACMACLTALQHVSAQSTSTRHITGLVKPYFWTNWRPTQWFLEEQVPVVSIIQSILPIQICMSAYDVGVGGSNGNFDFPRAGAVTAIQHVAATRYSSSGPVAGFGPGVSLETVVHHAAFPATVRSLGWSCLFTTSLSSGAWQLYG
jgi:hypothetical protein